MGAHSVSRDRSPCKLVVLSNGDPGMLEAAKQYHNIHFDKGISVVEANSLKPHRATYTKAAEISGLEPSRILFVTNHAFDCTGAKSADYAIANPRYGHYGGGAVSHKPIVVAALTRVMQAAT